MTLEEQIEKILEKHETTYAGEYYLPKDEVVEELTNLIQEREKEAEIRGINKVIKENEDVLITYPKEVWEYLKEREDI